MLGNEAFARGILEADARVVTTYPGTPMTEIVDLLTQVGLPRVELDVEYAVNEAVALETAIGCSWAGARAVVTFKHMGLNVAADPFHAFAYSGVKAGLVILCGADPGANSSTNEQDNRFYAFHSHVPVLEPSTVQECKDAVVQAMEISERFRVPVLVWASTRLCHSTSQVTWGTRQTTIANPPRETYAFQRQRQQYINARDVAVEHHRETLARLAELGASPEWGALTRVIPPHEAPPDAVTPPEDHTGILTSGVSFLYVMEALARAGWAIPVFKVGGSFPFPARQFVAFVEEHALARVLVVEELEPFLELQARATLHRHGSSLPVVGKLEDEVRPGGDAALHPLPRTGELSLELVQAFLISTASTVFTASSTVAPGAKLSSSRPSAAPPQVGGSLTSLALPRQPTFCPGCAHRSVMYVLERVQRALERAGITLVVGGDIGCYTMGIHPPFQLMDWVVNMGAGIGIAGGVARLSAFATQRVVALIGDSTFFHAGLQPLLNAVQAGLDLTVVLLDNHWTAMTGHQPTPGTPASLRGNRGATSAKSARPDAREKPLDLPALVEAVGARVDVVGGYDLPRLQRVIERAVDRRGVSVVIVDEECALVRGRRVHAQQRALARQGACYPTRRLWINEACTRCDECFLRLGCPAIVIEEGADGEARYQVDRVRCEGAFCHACEDLCPNNAIKVTEVNPHLAWAECVGTLQDTRDSPEEADAK